MRWAWKTWKEVVDKEVNDLHWKPSNAVVDCNKWREMSGKWSDSNIYTAC